VTLKEFDREKKKASIVKTTKVGQIAELKQDASGRLIADARTNETSKPSTPVVQPSPLTGIGCPRCGAVHFTTQEVLLEHMHVKHPAQAVKEPYHKQEPLTADQLCMGDRLEVSDKEGSGLVEVLKCYPSDYKGSTVGPSVYCEGVTDHNWSGLYFNQHLRQWKAVLIEGP
jgi:hypothetical protein